MRRGARVEELAVAGVALGMLGLALVFAAILTLNQTPKPIVPTGTATLEASDSAGAATSDATTANTISAVGITISPIPNLNPAFSGSATLEATASLTSTVAPTASVTLTSSATTTFTATFTNTATLTLTPTGTPTKTQVFTYTPYPTHTPYPTNTLLPTFTASHTPSATNTPTPTSTDTPTATPTSTSTNTNTPTATPTSTPTSTDTFTPSPTPCYLRPGYVPYYVQPGDTLYGIAIRVGLSLYSLQTANCLTTTTIRVGQVILVPPWSIHPPTVPIPVTPSPTRRK